MNSGPAPTPSGRADPDGPTTSHRWTWWRPGGGVEPGGRVLDASANRDREDLRRRGYRRLRWRPGGSGSTRPAPARQAERGASFLPADRFPRDARGRRHGTSWSFSSQVTREPARRCWPPTSRIAEAATVAGRVQQSWWMSGSPADSGAYRYDVGHREAHAVPGGWAAPIRSMGEEAQTDGTCWEARHAGRPTWIAEEAPIAGDCTTNDQYRDKGIPDRELLRRARELGIVTDGHVLRADDHERSPRLAGWRVLLLASTWGRDDVTIRDAAPSGRGGETSGASTLTPQQLDAAVCCPGAQLPGASRPVASPARPVFLRARAGRPVVRRPGRRRSTALPWFAIGGIQARNVEPSWKATSRSIRGCSSASGPGREPRPTCGLKPAPDSIPMLRSVASSMSVKAPRTGDLGVHGAEPAEYSSSSRTGGFSSSSTPPEGGTGDHDQPRDREAQPPKIGAIVPTKNAAAGDGVSVGDMMPRVTPGAIRPARPRGQHNQATVVRYPSASQGRATQPR